MRRNLYMLAAVMVLLVAGLLGVATRTQAQILTTGTIAGTVTNPSGKALSGVQITIVDTGQTDVTNANGYFAITDVLPGTHVVEASLVGFQPVRATNVVVTQELTTTISLQLQQREVRQLGTTTVVAPLIHKNVTPTLYTVTSKEEQLVRSQPNNLYQYPGALISQPGIVPDADGYPTIRGSKIDEINYMVDGITVVNPVDNGFSTNLVTVGMDRMNVYTGGYRAELGSSVGGVVNAVIKTGASMRGQAAVEATTGSWDYTGLLYEQGNVEKNGFNWYVSGNFFRTQFEKNSQVSALPASEDVVAKFIQPVGKNNRFTFLFNQGFEHYEYPVNDPQTGKPWGANTLYGLTGSQAIHNEIFNRGTNSWEPTATAQDYTPQKYDIESLTWSNTLSSTATLAAQAYRLGHNRQIHAGSAANGFDYFDSLTTNAGKLDYSNQLSENFQLRIGGEYIHADGYNRLIYNPAFLPTVNVVRGALPTADMNGYVSATVKPSSRLTADLGVRYESRKYFRRITPEQIAMGSSHYPLTRDPNGPYADISGSDMAVYAKGDPNLHDVTPRGGMTYQVNPSTIFKVSGGRFIQMPGSLFIEQVWLPFNNQSPDPTADNANPYVKARRKVFDLKPMRSDGVDVGVEHQFGNTFGLALTPYYRKTTREIVRGGVTNPDGTVNYLLGNEYQSIGHGHVRGLETKLTMRERHGVSGWITYTLQNSKNNSPGSQSGASVSNLAPIPEDEHRNNYDQKHTIYVVGQYVKGNFEINPMFELGSGYPYGGEGGDWYDANSEDPRYAFGPNGEKWPVLVNDKLQDPNLVNAYNTGWHKNLSITFRLYNNKQKSSYYFLQVQNILNSKDITSRVLNDPMTGLPWGPVATPVTYTDENGNQASATGYYEYKPYSRVPPIFVLLGLRQTF